MTDWQGNFEILQQVCAEKSVIRHVSKHRKPDGTIDREGNLKLWNDAVARFRCAGLPVVELTEPMRWSEDFGWFLEHVPGMYFGIGAGEDAPGLHTAGFCFDDDLITPALKALEALIS